MVIQPAWFSSVGRHLICVAVNTGLQQINGDTTTTLMAVLFTFDTGNAIDHGDGERHRMTHVASS